MNNFDVLEQSLKEKWNLFYHANVNAKMRTKIKLQVTQRRKKHIKVALKSSLLPREIKLANVFLFFSNICPFFPPLFFSLCRCWWEIREGIQMQINLKIYI